LSSIAHGTESQALQAPSSRRSQTFLRIVVLTVLFTAAASYEVRQLSSLSSAEVWIHLRTGSWILQNHAVPHTGLFSQYTNLSWNDSSWGFDLLLGIAYRLFGLRAIPIITMLLKVALAIVTYQLARAGRSRFWQSVLLSAVAQFLIYGLQPLPYVCSILFLAVELRILNLSRQEGSSTQALFWLPVLFVLWANLHAQFILGLGVLMLFAVCEIVEGKLRTFGAQWISNRFVSSDTGKVGLVALSSFAATLVNPYTYHLFPVALKSLYSGAEFKYFLEFQALDFRRPQHYVMMLLVMTAFLSLGRLRSIALFELAILLGATGVAFRIQRDNWFVVLPAIALFSSGVFWLPKEEESTASRARAMAWAWAALLPVAVILVGILALPGKEELINKLSETMPVKACDYIRAHQLRGPIFNTYAFGSFLTWYLPDYPVVIDVRNELYGDQMLDDYNSVIQGNRRIEDAPMLAQAGTLLLEKNSGLGRALTTFPVLEARYEQVYSDDLASVFVPLPTQDLGK